MGSPQKKQRVSGGNVSAEVALLCTAHTTGEAFWREHVSRRRPAKFDGLIADPSWQGSKWSNAYLREKSGTETVRVEVLTDGEEERRFGRGRETLMPLSRFLDHLEDPSSSDKRYYLTTQELSHDLEDRPSVCSPPVTQLHGDFPWCPALCGHLVLQNANIWFGSSTAPTSSGLHHDYHDNLYLLLRGTKHVTLFPPESHASMYTHGSLARLHPNGRINYVGALTNADGSHVLACAARDTASRLEGLGRALQQVQEAGGATVGGASAEEIEAEMEREMEAMLEAEMEGEEEGREEGDGWEGDEEGEEEGDEGGNGGGEDEDEEEEEEGSLVPSSMTRAIAQAVGAATTSSASAISSCSSSSCSSSSSSSSTTTSAAPPNFSRVDTSLPLPDLERSFPLYAALLALPPSAGGPLRVTLEAGQMLYIPAGWFHEVKSEGGGSEGHLAFNYWFHPPDALGEGCFARPYTSDFWRRDWESRGMRDGEVTMTDSS